jgi:hypothetical protein
MRMIWPLSGLSEIEMKGELNSQQKMTRFGGQIAGNSKVLALRSMKIELYRDTPNQVKTCCHFPRCGNLAGEIDEL